MQNGIDNGRRVIVSGLGVVSSIGHGIDAFTAGIKEGRHGASVVKSIDTTGFPSNIGAEVQNFNPGDWLKKINPDTIGRSSQFIIAATRMALADSGLNKNSLSAESCNVSIGTTDGEAKRYEQFAHSWLDSEGTAVPAGLTNTISANWLAESVCREFDIRGEAITLATACAAGNYAIGYGYDQIKTGMADIVICGGSDSFCRKNFTGFYRLGAMAPEKCQPFDKNRKGILVGEGAGCLILESLEHALARGTAIYGEIAGYALNCDAYHVMAPYQAGIRQCMRLAHQNAGITPAQVDYVCAHGTGTTINDKVEAAALREVFGDKLPPVSSIKSMLGHTMGAASALASIACLLGIRNGFIPPTINFEVPDPECDIDCVPNTARQQDLAVVQNNAFAFGGNNAVVIYRRYEK